MGDDSPLLTPEAACDRERERLLTPEAERNGITKDKNGLSPGADGGANGAIKRKFTFLEEESQLRRADSAGVNISAARSAEKYEKIKKVGLGAYGSVYMAKNTETGEIVAIKVASKKEDPVLGGFPLSLLREISILRRLKHESIVQMHEVAHTPGGEPLIVMEYCQSSLQELLNSRHHGLSFSEVKYVIRQVLDATRHMHEKGILHRDLATKNVLFNISGEIKVCDFGISRIAFGQDEEFGFVPARDLEDPNMIVSLPYRAIELLLGQRNYGPPLDVWSAGCIFGEILLCQAGNRRTFFGGERGNPNKTPQTTVDEIFSILGKPNHESWPNCSRLSGWRSLAGREMKEHTGRGDEVPFVTKFFMTGAGKCASTKYSLPTSCYDLLGGLMTLCPAHRLTAEEALKSTFFTSEKPAPEWHAWHWALASKEIARTGDKQSKDEADNKEAIIKELNRTESFVEVKSATGAETHVMSTKEKMKRDIEQRANERKQKEQEEIKHRQLRALEEKLPPGWTKHWSNSKNRYYYHDNKTGENLWHPPPSNGAMPRR